MQRSGVNILDPVGEVLGREEYDQWWFVQGRRYYLKDHLGSTRVVLDGNGSVVETRDHYPFGLEMPGRSFVSGQRTKENFTGHELDDESGLVYAGARYYMPGVGRWTSVDPLGGDYPGSSPYNYALNNPANLFDPTGLCPESVKHGEVWQGARCYRPNGEEIVVEASRISGASSFTHDGTLYFDASTREGRDGLYHTLRANPNLVGHVLSGNYSLGAQQVAMTASIHNAHALALRIALETGADVAMVVSLMSGVGTVTGVGAFLLRRGGVRHFTKQGAIGIIQTSGSIGLRSSFAETGLRYSAVPLGGSLAAANRAAVGLGFSSAGQALPTLRVGVRTTDLAGPAFRNAASGRFVSDLYGISVFGGVGVGGSAPAFYFYFTE